MDNNKLEQFKRLFRGRGDVWGHDEGRCVKEKLTDEHWIDHLAGRSGIGIYPAVPTPDGQVICAWGCTDIDVEDLGQAQTLWESLYQAGIVSFIERSRSKGYHVWIFADRPVPAQVMRDAQLAAHQVAGLRPIEVNPKQTNVSATKYGNYVRLPYAGGADKVPDRRVMIDPDSKPIPLQSFIDTALDNLTPLSVLERAASCYQPPPKTHTIDNTIPSSELQDILSTLSGLTYTVYRDGPLERHDRSNTLVKLAHKCADDGLAAQNTLTVIRAADVRWGKFHERADCEEQLQKIIEKVYL